MALTELVVRKALTTGKDYKLGDGDGLWLKVTANGGKLWHLRYTYLGKESVTSLGEYPVIGLKEAREKAMQHKKLLLDGVNPTEKKREAKRLARFNADNTFKAIATEWFQANTAKWTDGTAKNLWRRLELHIFPRIGSRPIADISALELLDALRRPEEKNKTETTHRALHTCRCIFRYAVVTQRLKYNPTHDLQGALKAHRTINYPTIGHNQVPEFLEKLEVVNTSMLNRLAVKLLMLTFVRQGELRRARWTDFDLKAAEWRVRAETTKMRTLHNVPLSAQAVQILTEVRRLYSQSAYVFPSQQSRRNPFMSENTINKVIHEMGYKGLLVGHGFRSLASTVLNESGFRPDVIERQLAHMPRDQVRAAYNRAEYLPERRQMMEWWGDFLAGVGLN